jgi:putative peptidoglycan lipid II flippase
MMLWLLPLLLGNKNYKLAINWRHPGLHQIRRLSLPWIASNSFAKGTSVIDTILASFLLPGSLTYINYAYRLITMSVNLVSRGAAISIFPRISQSYAQSNPDEFRHYFSTGIRFISIIAFPVTGLIVILNRPVIQLLFEKNNFTTEDTLATSLAVIIYTGAFIALSLGTIVSNSFYARHNTKTPAIISIISIFLQAGLAYLLIPHFSYLGLAISFTIFANLKLFVMVYLLRKQGQKFDGNIIFKSLLKMSIASILMSIIVFVTWHYLEAIAQTSPLLILSLITVGVLSIITYGVLLLLLRSPEIAIILNRLQETLIHVKRNKFS